ncbi:MAG: nitrogenase cofactor biosynthesis protein NifB [Treponema sp.]|jgi:nitrogenase molybdenum-iron protein alpha/beta subunit/MoaA/NifB/PqqE/SkfB family radical SAM enzyme|nr:nitrogenase cofactor biosynthesis protein NifB [Treponema sp.]
MIGNLVSLNVNPCKMCMPMGAVSALCGIKSSMSILHGSQGCATYIRRHMATHYNEPVDIASSSLTEEGTVFGGEANLLRGLRNMIDLYAPEVIGVCTTCLAETIGEDVNAIVKKFYAQNPGLNVKIINIASPGYGGTQNEGWFAALRAILEQTEPDTTRNGKINIITPQISPADTRWLKHFFEEMDITFIMFPDLSENLDGATEKKYRRLKTGGTAISDIAAMAGAKFTIEFSEFTDEKNSPAEFLRSAYGVPSVKLPLPIGLRGMDKLIDVLIDDGDVITGKTKKARGRYLDAMVDSHKHCAEARAAVFGEPDFTAAMVRLCCENGILPVVAATGSVSEKLRETLSSEVENCAEFHFDEGMMVLDDSDFAEIEKSCVERKANLLIGSSDGRRIARKLNIPLIRCAFPIHDHVGGQRVRMFGFDGTLNLLDMIANAMIDKTETTFRGELYDKFFDGQEKDKTATHPCFGEHACKNARVHLPVAAECNIQCNYCLRNYDCMNESRPGVASKILSPDEALERYKNLKETMPNLTVAGIAGPGDALANFENTSETFRLIRDFDPDVTFCIATNGLLLPQYVSRLKALGVSHVTVTVNAVDPAVGAKIYHHVNYMGMTYTGEQGAAILLANQLAGIKMLVDAGMICKVNCVVLKGVNDGHVFEVTKKVSELGAFMTNVMPHIPVKGSAFEGLERVTNKEIEALREQCGAHVKQMTHCRQCRSDAAGTLDDDLSIEFTEPVLASKTLETDQTEDKLKRFAVASKTGAIVDLHFGHADKFYIYESDDTETRFVETRSVSKYCDGTCDKEDKWASVIRAVSDCDAVLALRIGPTPERRLQENGIYVITTYERVETAVSMAAREIKERRAVYGIA